MNQKNAVKKTWTTPKVEVHGTVEQITQQVKNLGGADGIMFNMPDVGPVAIGS